MILNGLQKEKFWYLNRNWRIKNQILAIQIITLLLVLAFLASSIFIGSLIIQGIIQDSSDIIFLRQTMQQLDNVWIYKQHLLYILNSAHMQIQMVSFLNIFLLEKNNSIINPVQCLNKPKTNDSYCYSSSFCFGLFGDKYTDSDMNDLHQIYGVTSTLTQFKIAIENVQALYFSHANTAQFYTLSQGFYFKQGFKPHSRPWYANHVNLTKNNSNILQVVYGIPYQIFLGGIRIPMTMNLINQNFIFEGVVAKDIDFNQTQVFRTIDNATTINIINLQGLVVFSKLYDNPNQTFYNLSNTNYSGFDQEDFTQIINYHNQNQFESNCSGIKTPASILCLYNSIVMDFNIIQTAQIGRTPYILVIQKKTKEIKQSYDNQIDLISNQVILIMRRSLILLLLISLAVLIISQIISYIILKQLKLLIDYTKVNLYESFILNLHMEAMKHKYCIQSTTVTNLYTRVIDLIHNLKPKKKCEQCQLEEEKQLPRCSKISRRLKVKLKQDLSLVAERKIYKQIFSYQQIFNLRF